jgi:hypothetical protein
MAEEKRREVLHLAKECGEPSGAEAVEVDGRHRRAERSAASPPKEERREGSPAKPLGGRPHKRWKIRVLRIDASKYPQFAQDKDHPFARMAVGARLEEIDSFFARLRVRRTTPKPASGGWSAAA